MPIREVSLIDLIVHELRTPLTVATGSLRQLSAVGDATQQATLARALRSCERLERLTSELRDWTRVSAASVNPVESAIGPMVHEAVRQAAGIRSDVRVVADLTSDLTVTATPEWLPRALTKLLMALVRAAERGETVTVQARAADASIEIAFRRPGAPESTPEQFEAEWIGGLGFSMPLARAIVEAAGGRVGSHATTDGRLAAISVRLPTSAAPPSAR